MKFLFNLASIASFIAIASGQAAPSTPSSTDITAATLTLINAKRNGNWGDMAEREKISSVAEPSGTDLTDVNDAMEALAASIVDSDCATYPAEAANDAYGRIIIPLTTDISTPTAAVDAIMGQIVNYECHYPPSDAHPVSGSVDEFTIMMDMAATHAICHKTTECTGNDNVFMCLFSPKFAGDPGHSITYDTFQCLTERENLCVDGTTSSGSYFGEYTGFLFSLAALAVGSSYMLA